MSSEEKQRVWIVYYPDETSADYHPTRIAEGLADTFDVKLICGHPTAVRYFKKGDRVLVAKTPIMPFVVAIASLFRGASYTLLIRDGKTRAGLIDYFDRWLYKYAAKIIIVGRDLRELIEQKAALGYSDRCNSKQRDS